MVSQVLNQRIKELTEIVLSYVIINVIFYLMRVAFPITDLFYSMQHDC